jgi:hypothetical protein
MEPIMFNKLAYDVTYAKQLESLVASEKTTRTIVLELSRSILEALHASGDIGYVNRFIDALTPMNKKTAVLYFKEFSGFHFTEADAQFGKKDKKTYDGKAEASVKFLDDPLNNLWSWASRNIEVEKKEFSLDAVTTYMTATLKKAGKANIAQADVLRAVLKAGITAESIMAIIAEMDVKQA